MSSYEALSWLATHIIVPVTTGLLGRFIGDYFSKKQNIDPKGKKHSWLWFIILFIFAFIIIETIQYAGEYNIKITQPIMHQNIMREFELSGTAGRPSEDPYIYVVVRDMESTGAQWTVTDATVSSPDGDWTGVGQVPRSTPLKGDVQVYVLRSGKAGLYKRGDTYQIAPFTEKKGGRSNVITVTNIQP